MKLEQQVCSLELAEKLAELGVAQDSVFYWLSTEMWIDGEKDIDYSPAYVKSNKVNKATIVCSAYTVAELGEMLPDGIWSEKRSGFWKVFRETEMPSALHDTEADARAKCLIYLLEQGMIKA